MPRRHYFRTSTKEITDGLIENFRLDMLPANPAVCLDFGILDDDAERKFDALKWMWDQGRFDRASLMELKNDGPALTEAVNVPENPFAPVTYSTLGDDIRAWEARHRALDGEE